MTSSSSEMQRRHFELTRHALIPVRSPAISPGAARRRHLLSPRQRQNVFINTRASASPTTNNIHDEIKYSLRNWQLAGERRLFPVLCSELGGGGGVCPAAMLRFQATDTAFTTHARRRRRRQSRWRRRLPHYCGIVTATSSLLSVSSPSFPHL